MKQGVSSILAICVNIDEKQKEENEKLNQIKNKLQDSRLLSAEGIERLKKEENQLIESNLKLTARKEELQKQLEKEKQITKC